MMNRDQGQFLSGVGQALEKRAAGILKNMPNKKPGPLVGCPGFICFLYRLARSGNLHNRRMMALPAWNQ